MGIPTGMALPIGPGRGIGKAMGPGPMMRPVVPPRGVTARRLRKPVRFVVEKGPAGLR